MLLVALNCWAKVLPRPSYMSAKREQDPRDQDGDRSPAPDLPEIRDVDDVEEDVGVARGLDDLVPGRGAPRRVPAEHCKTQRGERKSVQGRRVRDLSMVRADRVRKEGVT